MFEKTALRAAIRLAQKLGIPTDEIKAELKKQASDEIERLFLEEDNS